MKNKIFTYEENLSLCNVRAKPIQYIITENGCWECISHACDAGGYPIICRKSLGFKQGHMSRYVYESFHGSKIPNDSDATIGYTLYIRHRCDNPKCINPKHMELGKHEDNMRDKYERNRQTKGEDVYTAKLTSLDVAEIKKMIMQSITNRHIAKIYNVNESTVSGIKLGLYWNDVYVEGFTPYNTFKKDKSNKKNEILELIKKGLTQSQISKIVGCTQSRVSQIKRCHMSQKTRMNI